MFGLYAWCLLEADNAYAFWFLLGIEQFWGLFTVLILYYHLQPCSLNIFFVCFWYCQHLLLYFSEFFQYTANAFEICYSPD